MITLTQQQESLRAILKGRAAQTAGDPWLEEVSSSRGLAMLRITIAWWQRFQIESQCRYTARLLKRQSAFATSVTACFAQQTASPAIEELGVQFLSWLSAHKDPLVRSVAAFERACLAPPRIGQDHFAVVWDRNPVDVLLALESNTSLPPTEPGIRYTLVLSPSLPQGMICTREQQGFSVTS